MMALPMVQEKAEQIFLMQPKMHQFKFVEPTNPLWIIAFLSSARLLKKRPVSLTSSRNGNSQRRRKWLSLQALVAMVPTTGTITKITMTITKATNAIATTAITIIATTMINTTITLVATRRASKKAHQEKR
jgi:hypothetical protein